MYAGVPIAMPAPASGRGSLGAGSVRAAVSAFAMPKSVTTAVPPAEQHVVRLDVAVDDAALVRVGERRATSRRMPIASSIDRRAAARQPRPQRLAVDVRHREVREPSRLAGREHRHDVRMLQLRGELDLATEALDVDPPASSGAGP